MRHRMGVSVSFSGLRPTVLFRQFCIVLLFASYGAALVRRYLAVSLVMVGLNSVFTNTDDCPPSSDSATDHPPIVPPTILHSSASVRPTLLVSHRPMCLALVALVV
jgi:hypothetical protein